MSGELNIELTGDSSEARAEIDKVVESQNNVIQAATNLSQASERAATVVAATAEREVRSIQDIAAEFNAASETAEDFGINTSGSLALTNDEFLQMQRNLLAVERQSDSLTETIEDVGEASEQSFGENIRERIVSYITNVATLENAWGLVTDAIERTRAEQDQALSDFEGIQGTTSELLAADAGGFEQNINRADDASLNFGITRENSRELLTNLIETNQSDQFERAAQALISLTNEERDDLLDGERVGELIATGFDRLQQTGNSQFIQGQRSLVQADVIEQISLEQTRLSAATREGRAREATLAATREVESEFNPLGIFSGIGGAAADVTQQTARAFGFSEEESIRLGTRVGALSTPLISSLEEGRAERIAAAVERQVQLLERITNQPNNLTDPNTDR